MNTPALFAADFVHYAALFRSVVSEAAQHDYAGTLAVSFGTGPAADPIGQINHGIAEGRMIAGDFDSDGDIDFLYQAGNIAGSGFGFLENNGSGGFINHTSLAGTPFSSFNFAA